ncbi:MAG TPA: class I SAM-dependent methyltransferase [Puia sp.]|nr:class I SAM-dependent methyltransferase [Puia sp.]
MKRTDAEVYKCPACTLPFILNESESRNDDIIEGYLVCSNNHKFVIKEGIPDFTWPKNLAIIDQETKQLYDKLADDYEKFASFPFQTFREKEEEVREKMTDKLNLSPSNVVLEVGGGDGRAAIHIINRIPEGQLYFQELSSSFMSKAFYRLETYTDKIHFSIANASYLSFSDNYFDAAFHFGGINTFAEIKRCLQELARVVKPGGKVVVGDEGIGPWLRNTEFGKIMINSNPLIGYVAPVEMLPVEARNVKVEWILMGAFFLIEFIVGDSEPNANYHIPIPSERGGSHWSRYYGNLEGISDEGKKLAQAARAKTGKSMHDWLDQVVKDAAKNELDK